MTITSIVPNRIPANSRETKLQITGTEYPHNSTVTMQFKGQPEITLSDVDVESPTYLTCVIPTKEIPASPIDALIRVKDAAGTISSFMKISFVDGNAAVTPTSTQAVPVQHAQFAPPGTPVLTPVDIDTKVLTPAVEGKPYSFQLLGSGNGKLRFALVDNYGTDVTVSSTGLVESNGHIYGQTPLIVKVTDAVGTSKDVNLMLRTVKADAVTPANGTPVVEKEKKEAEEHWTEMIPWFVNWGPLVTNAVILVFAILSIVSPTAAKPYLPTFTGLLTVIVLIGVAIDEFLMRKAIEKKFTKAERKAMRRAVNTSHFFDVVVLGLFYLPMPGFDVTIRWVLIAVVSAFDLMFENNLRIKTTKEEAEEEEHEAHS